VGSFARTWILLRTRLAATSTVGEGIAALLFQAIFTAAFCGLVRGGLPPFAYGLFAFSLMVALIGIPLLGELGYLLRRDPAQEWVEALAIRPAEVRLARTGELLWILGAQALACGIPAALLAPEGTALLARLAIPLLAIGMAMSVAALLLLLQSLLGGRAEGLFVLLQTILVAGVIVGGIVGLSHLDTLARLPELGDERVSFLWLLPPAWFAAPLVETGATWLAMVPAGVTLSSLLVLGLLPAPAPVRRSGRSEPLIERLLRPARYLAERVWVRAREHGGFLLVYEGLPREREVVLRTYPMLGIPLAFGAIGAQPAGGEPGTASDMTAILLFTVSIYLPVLLSYVPATSSPRAAWVHATAPVRESELHGGAIKALAVRFLIPLYFILGVLTWFTASPELCVRLLPPAFLTSLLVLRKLYPICVGDPPMSMAPDEVETHPGWMMVMTGAALGLTFAGVIANRMLSLEASLALCALLVTVEIVSDRRMAAGPTPES